MSKKSESSLYAQAEEELNDSWLCRDEKGYYTEDSEEDMSDDNSENSEDLPFAYQRSREGMKAVFRIAMKQNKPGQPVRLNGQIIKFNDSGKWAIRLAKKEFDKTLVWKPVA